jgi:hypothetical protein
MDFLYGDYKNALVLVEEINNSMKIAGVFM